MAVTIVTDARGVRHEVPDIWLIGYQTGARARGDDASILAALDAWLVQDWLKETEEVNAMQQTDLKCDGWCDGANPVAMIGNKGYAYCAPCGVQRRESGYENVRKLRPHELATLRRGESLRRY